MFRAARSRWTIPFFCKWNIPLAIPKIKWYTWVLSKGTFVSNNNLSRLPSWENNNNNNLFVIYKLKRGEKEQNLNRRPPPQYSKINIGLFPYFETPNTWTIFGCGGKWLNRSTTKKDIFQSVFVNEIWKWCSERRPTSSTHTSWYWPLCKILLCLILHCNIWSLQDDFSTDQSTPCRTLLSPTHHQWPD